MQQSRPQNPGTDRRRRERLIALAVLGALLFNYPLLALFGVGATVFGLPLLFLYVFAAWGLFLWLVARILRHDDSGPGDGG